MSLIPFENIENFRDSAEYTCAYGPMTKGIIYRSGSLSHATEEDLEKLYAMGIRSEIDLRGTKYSRVSPSPLYEKGVKVLELDVPNGEGFVKDEEGVPGWYMSFVENPYFSRKVFQAFVNLPKPLLLHCEAGKDRTGTFLVLLLLANGVSKEDAMHSYNFSYHDGVLEKTKCRTIEHYGSVPDFVFNMSPETIGTFIDQFFERYGSIDNYFETIGLSDSEIGALKNLYSVQETSAGAVVFHGNKVLVEHMALGHYSIPKGHVEKTDKDLFDTARREIKEETGLDATILPGFATSTVYSPRPGHVKRVHWFIATVENENVSLQPEEVSDVYFLSPADALRVLTHEDDRRVLTEACNEYFKD